MDLTIIITVSVFFMMLLTVFGISSYASSRTKQKEWTQRLRGKEEFAPAAWVQDNSSPEQPRLFKFLGSLGEAAKPKNVDEMSHMRRTLIKAGYRSVDAPLIFFGARLLIAIVLPAVFAVLRTSALPMLSYMHTMVLFVLLAVAGFYAPNLWVKMRTQRRQRKITEGFPDALDLMTVCVEAGLGLDAALNQVAAEISMNNQVLGEELKLVNLELRAGQSRQNALRNLSLRTDLEDVNNFTTLLIQTDHFGTSMGQALRVHSDTMRTKRHSRAEEAAAKLPVKLLFPLVFFIFPSMFVVILGPAVIQIIRILLPTMAAK
ncbi:MAG TPA: type II secretion system F family protein [Alphaproteobacteria bacterium]|nr:type II secretion system F family protein [Alphaproteobacteria bacterium]